ncbi:MAG TPA: hypothetical protein VGO67_13695 [Verrucomicrobiae bacterium]|jgi:hypothetical protein
MNEILLSRINRMQRLAWIVGGISAAVCVVGACVNLRQFLISYLFAWLFWLGLSLGCLCVAMIHHLTGGRWGDVTRRFLEAGYLTLPLMAVLFVPILLGLRELYPWAIPGNVVNTPVLQHRASYLNITAFIIRACFFFIVWISMAICLRNWSRRQDTTADLAPTRLARTLSGPGVVIYALTVTFAWIDWLMSLEPDWYSTMFAVIICGGQILSTFAFVIMILAWFKDQPPFSPVVQSGQFHQLGNLMLTFVMFWTYVCFGQLLIIWSGNLPKEIIWYLHRIAGHWKWLAEFLGLFNFLLPFLILLFRASKKNPQALRRLAALVFLCQILYAYWLVEPSFYQTGVHLHWLDFAAPLALGCFWIAMFASALKRAAFLIQHDPRISYSFAHA